MKRVLVLMLFASNFAQAQTAYTPDLTFNLGDSTDADIGVTFKRKATIEAMVYNQRTSTINVQVLVKFFNNQKEIRRLIKPHSTQFTITNNTFVLAQNGNVVGNREAMRSLYGVVEKPATDTSATVWRQSVFGGDSLTAPCMGQYDYIVRSFDSNNRLHKILKQLSQQAALEGKLND